MSIPDLLADKPNPQLNTKLKSKKVQLIHQCY